MVKLVPKTYNFFIQHSKYSDKFLSLHGCRLKEFEELWLNASLLPTCKFQAVNQLCIEKQGLYVHTSDKKVLEIEGIKA